MNGRHLISLPALLLLFATMTQQPCSFAAEWVIVGDPGNSADWTGYGAVGEEFRIMKYEFTNQQYTDFLNSVAATDTYSLYNPNMGSNSRGGIVRRGSPGSYTYSVKENMGNKPVNFVSWFNAARVSNWYQNGATSLSTTETGAYSLGGMTSGNAPAVNSGAAYFLPMEDQWYKAAFYNPSLKDGAGGYRLYGNGFDDTPGSVSSNEFGNGSAGATGNFANYNSGAIWDGQTGNVTTVGTNGSPSFYGAYDMSGNVYEWNDLTGSSNSERGLRGGRWLSDNAIYTSSVYRVDVGTEYAYDGGGFRLASIALPPDSHLVFQPVPLTSNYNGSLNNKYTNPPTGSVLLGGVPFSIPSNGLNFWDALAVTQGPEPVSVEIPVNVFAVRNVDTLINTHWGLAGPTSHAAIEFLGDGGAFFRVDLVGNDHIRDYANNSFPNDINGVTTRQVHADKDPIANWDTRIDKQRFELPAAFSEEVLVSVRVFDNGDFREQRLMLSGLTVSAEASTLIEVDSGSATQSTLGYEVLTGSNAFRKAGAGELVMDRPNSLSGITRVESGGLILADASALRYSRIKVLDNASISVADSVATSVAELTLLPAAVLNIGSGSLTVMRGLTGDQAEAELLKGRGDGFWTGTSGITSTAAAADLQAGIVRSVGWKSNSDGSVTVAYAAPGDTNLDGEVNVFDLVNVNGSGTYGRGTPSNWSQGDFDYNGVTNIFDMVQTNGAGVYGRGSYLPATPTSVNAVPEPATWLLAFTGLAGSYYMLRRRGA